MTFISTLPCYDNTHACVPFPRTPGKDDIINAAVLDTETTGLIAGKDVIIEIAILPFQFHRQTGRLLMVGESLVMQQDPGFPIPAEATAANHITNDMVAGKSIDWNEVWSELEGVDFLIVHNAGFDRAFVDRELNTRGFAAGGRVWVCSFEMLKWDCPVSKQEVLFPWFLGMTYEAHRAEADTNALLHLLHTTGRLPELAEKASQPSYELRCHTDILGKQLKFSKDLNAELKREGFRFMDGGTEKLWRRSGLASTEEAGAVRDRLMQGHLKGTTAPKLFTLHQVAPNTRYGIGQMSEDVLAPKE